METQELIQTEARKMAKSQKRVFFKYANMDG
jgi:hypothetical protein